VTEAGTAEALSATSIGAREVVIHAKSDNVGRVFVGDSTVSSADGEGLIADDSLSFGSGLDHPAPVDLTNVYIDAANAGDGVDVYYVELS